MQDFPFDFEFMNETDLPDGELYELAFDQITEAAEGHSDITGASIHLEELSTDETPHAFQARVVLYVRPSNISATEVEASGEAALQEALDEAIRQVRDKRDKLRNY
jgi:hypothetical protein